LDSSECDPMHPDSDRGGIPDGQEVRNGTNALDPHDPSNEGVKWTLEDVNFEFDKAVLLPEAYRKLNIAVRMLKENPQMVVEVGGHTDNVGTDNYNYSLSDERSKTVREYLVSQGIEPNRIISKGYGENRPVAPNDLDEGRAINRRTEFTVIKGKEEQPTGPTSQIVPEKSSSAQQADQVKAPAGEEKSN